MRTNKILVLILCLMFLGCKNPFSPALNENPNSSSSLLSDLTTIDGVFQNFQYAYTFKDTIIYGQLINPDFTFTYITYPDNFSVSWGRDTEMKTTYGLFQNAEKLDLIWDQVVLSSVDSLTANVVRAFNLTVTFNPTDVITVDGRVNMNLKKDPVTQKWSITQWVDESNF
jgi:hypothetical protein